MRHLWLVLLLLFTWTAANADEAKKSGKPEKPYSVSVGVYQGKFSISSLPIDLDFSGYSLSIGQVFSDNFAGRFTYYSTDWDEFSGLDSDGVDIVLHWGTGLASKGFKAYIGGGWFKDTWEVTANLSGTPVTGKESFSGLQISGGIGYNWESIALDLVLAVRDPDDYEKAFLAEVDPYTGSLLLSYRF